MTALLDRARHQPNRWTCGPSALRHGMLWHGYDMNVRVLAEQAVTTCCHANPTPMEGACEHGLAQAAVEHGFTLPHFFGCSTTETYRSMRLLLPVGPVLLAVDHFSHWLTVVRGTTRNVWLIDSDRSVELHQRTTWRRLFTRLAYGLPGEVVFHFYPLLTK